jgi:hypothetical protein
MKFLAIKIANNGRFETFKELNSEVILYKGKI